MSLKMPFTTRSTHHAAFKLVKDKINKSMAEFMLTKSLVKICHKRYIDFYIMYVVSRLSASADLLEEVNFTQQRLQTKYLTLDKAGDQVKGLHGLNQCSMLLGF